MKLLYIIAQEDDGRYVSIRLDAPIHRTHVAHSTPDSDAPTGIFSPMTPEDEAEEDEVKTLKKQQDLGDIDKVLEKNRRKDEVSEEGL